ncbi:MAG TPA: glutaredoxin family protein [Actinomycetota bacterium]|nr:glutaredoxin family protein [Actinomycetota bacterium]
MAETITMYSTTWCGHCRRLTRQLDDAGIDYRVVDVDDNPQFDDRIVAATGGYRVVPTLEIGDELLVNPSLSQVKAALQA